MDKTMPFRGRFMCSSLAWQRSCLLRDTPLETPLLVVSFLTVFALMICHFPNSLRDSRICFAYILSADVFAFLFCPQKSLDTPNFSRTLQNDKPSSPSRTIHALPPLHPATNLYSRLHLSLQLAKRPHNALPSSRITPDSRISMERCPRTYPSRRPPSTASMPSIPA